jgi:riboflavin kinase/FMN adenylyltransferase
MQFSGTSLEDIKNSDIGVTIGSFDGVHKGHQYILDEFVYKCAKKNLRPVVISFTPHPLVVIKNLENF